MEQVVFTGNYFDAETSGYFQYHWTPDLTYGDYKLGCSGWSEELLEGRQVDHRNEGRDVLTWGYASRSSDLLSISLLATSLKPTWILDHVWHCYRHPERDLILKHYRAFTEEIVANLPDSWTMTSDEVLAWLKKKEKQ